MATEVIERTKGPRGPSGTMEVGSTSTLASGEDATVTNSGSSTEAVLDFGIPQGDALVFRGAWDNTATYAQSEAVTHSDKLWAANSDTNAGEEPGVSGKWTEIPTVNQILTDTTFNIPTDYATLQAAVDDLADRFVQRGVTVTLNIESGHALTGGLLCQYGDYSMFNITSDDATVTLDGSWSGVDESALRDPVATLTDLLIVGEDAQMPQLGCKVGMGGVGGGGVLLQNCRMSVSEGAGVTNAGDTGILTRASMVDMSLSVWDGASAEGMRLTLASHIHASGATADNCGGPALFVSRASVAHFQNGSAQNSGGDAILAHRSWVNAHNANLDGAGDSAVKARLLSNVIAASATLTNATGNAARTQTGARIVANNADCSNAGGRAIECLTGYIQAEGATIDGCTGDRAIYVDGGRVEAIEAVATNYTGSGMWCNGGDLTARGIDLTTSESGTARGLRAVGGGRINIDGGTIDRPESPDSNDIEVVRGGIVNAGDTDNGSGGSPGTSQTPNSITSDGIIFQ